MPSIPAGMWHVLFECDSNRSQAMYGTFVVCVLTSMVDCEEQLVVIATASKLHEDNSLTPIPHFICILL